MGSEDDEEVHDNDEGNDEQESFQMALHEVGPCWIVLYIRVGSVKMIKTP